MNRSQSGNQSKPPSNSANPPPQSSKKTEEEACPSTGLPSTGLLHESAEIQSLILSGIGDPSWIKTIDGVFLAVNRAWCVLVGKEEAEAIGKRDSEIFAPEIYLKHAQHDALALSTGKSQRIEDFFSVHGGGTWFDVVISPMTGPQGEIAGVLGIARDITERKVMEEKFLRTQRMDSIGSLAGGIAHDLNNILGPIMMSASMLRENLPQATRLDLISTIQDAAKRGAEIVSQVLTFTRGTHNDTTTLNPRGLILQVEKILRDTLSKSITLNFTLPEDLWNITGNITRFQQVLVNLCVNARDAMPQGGPLAIRAENCELSLETAAHIAQARPGRFVKIEVADSGTGISREIIGKIFEPFFTTKELGKGTGLGLSTVLGIVKSHGGFITVESELNQGAKFSVYFPATTRESAPASQPHHNHFPDGQGQKVLVVDDELPICKMVQTILNSKCYETMTALSAREALDIYAQHKDAIQLVLTDVAMPDIDGVTLIRRLKSINPELAIIASTGQPPELRHKELSELHVHHFLHKPYNANQLLTSVQKALGDITGP